MSEPSLRHSRDDATQRFYQQKRTSTPQRSPSARCVADMQRVSTISFHSGVSSEAVFPLTNESVLDSLEAFMNAREEDAVGLLATFTQLTEQDKVKALAQLEGGALSGKNDDGEKDSTDENQILTATRKPVANYAALRRRLRECDRVQRRTEQRHHQRERNSERHIDVNGMPQERITAKTLNCAPYTVAVDLREDDDLETVELEDGTHTGNLVAFFDKGVTDVSTTFDNFFGALGEYSEAAHDKSTAATLRATTTATAATLAAPPSALLTLDDILALESGAQVDQLQDTANSSEIHSYTDEQALDHVGNGHILVTTNCEVGASSRSSSSSFSGSMSDASSVVLPGLDNATDNDTQRASTPRFNDDHHIMETEKAEALFSDVAADLLQVIAEHDDCVQTFALDPLFDYDADVLGEAFRKEKAWRQ